MKMNNTHRNILLVFITAILFIFVNPSFATSEPPPENNQPLVKISKNSGFDNARFVEDIDFKKYTHIFLQQPMVTFQKSWERDHRTDVSSRYKKMIVDDYSKLLTDELTTALTANETITIVGEEAINQENTLIITPRIMNLYINAPETIAASTAYVHEAGHATLQLQLMDTNKHVIGVIEDNKDTINRGFLNRPQRASRVTNYSDFRLLIRDWAEDFAELLQNTPIKIHQ